tara:strand:- start:223 stop:735 length:513 start_codon:yes stop_codon:yes gene_type:complete
MTDASNRKQRFCKILLEEANIRKSLNENLSLDESSRKHIEAIVDYQYLPHDHSSRTSSEYQKLHNTVISLEAEKILKISKDFKEFHSKTTNEHQNPVSNIWKWILDNCEKLKWKDVENYIDTYSLVTISKKENDKLRITKNVIGDPKKRYEEAGIIVTLLDKPPKDFFKN